jgi:hypothetical protein
MCDRLKEITQRVNMVMGRNYNTILMNVYKNNKDCFAAHQDNENGWVKGSGFATLAFGCERPFVICEIATKNREKIIHKSGEMIELPYPMNFFLRIKFRLAQKRSQWREVGRRKSGGYCLPLER